MADDHDLLPPGTPAPNFVADGPGGGSLRLSDYRGRIVVLDFWASWCPGCVDTMPGLEDVAQKYSGRNVVVIALNSDDGRQNALDWIHAHPSSITYAIDPAGKHLRDAIGNGYQVRYVPSTFVIDQNGVIARSGELDEEDITDAIDRLSSSTGHSFAPGVGRQTYIPVKHMELKGYMSGKVVDPYAGLTESAALTKANELLSKGRFGDLEALTKSMDKRKMTRSLGPIYNALGDHAGGLSKPDEAWGWYLLTTMYAHAPALIAHARFGIADYMTSIHNADKARDQWQAVVDLVGVDDVDKAKAQGLLAGK